MSSPANPRITLELAAGSDPIQGSIEHADGTRQAFWGWLELIETLRSLADSGSRSGARARRGHPSTAEEEA
jgi:hypothetical protein